MIGERRLRVNRALALPALDALRRKRNLGAYDDYGLVSQAEADHGGKLASRIRRQVEDWIGNNHSDKI